VYLVLEEVLGDVTEDVVQGEGRAGVQLGISLDMLLFTGSLSWDHKRQVLICQLFV
jgi:hypothetical protein